MLQSTPFIEVASSVATNTKNLAENAAKGAKGLVENAATTENPDGTGSSNMLRNIIIFLLISAVIISVFYFIVYVLRKVNPPLEKTNTEKEIKRIADSCLRDKSDSWVNAQIEKLKTFLTNKKQIN
jgi:predicted secreted protein